MAPFFFLACWAALTIGVMVYDAKRRRNAGELRDGAVWPYMVLGVVLPVAALPAYFGMTRRSARGVALGVLMFVATWGVAAALTYPVVLLTRDGDREHPVE